MHKGLFQGGLIYCFSYISGNRLPKVTCILLFWMTKYHSNAVVTRISGASEMGDKNQNGIRPE